MWEREKSKNEGIRSNEKNELEKCNWLDQTNLVIPVCKYSYTLFLLVFPVNHPAVTILSYS